MSPHPQITPAPVLRPRQSDQYLSSLYAELSSMYPDLYSSYSYDGSYYSSLLDSIRSDSDYYSSILNDIYSGYSIPLPTATDDTLVRTGSTTDPTGVSRGSSTSNTSSSGGGGLSTGAKIGIGVGVPLALLLLIGIGVFIWCAGKRRGKKSSTTVVAPPTSTQYQPHAQIPVQNQPPQPPQMGYANNQGYMPGYQQQGYQNMPPPQYVQPSQGAYPVAGYAKPPEANVVELEQEYHFARPGVIEMGDGMPEQAQGKKKGNK